MVFPKQYAGGRAPTYIDHACFACDKAAVHSKVTPIWQAYSDTKDGIEKSIEYLESIQRSAERVGERLETTEDPDVAIAHGNIRLSRLKDKLKQDLELHWKGFYDYWGTRSDQGKEIMSRRDARSEVDEDKGRLGGQGSSKSSKGSLKGAPARQPGGRLSR